MAKIFSIISLIVATFWSLGSGQTQDKSSKDDLCLESADNENVVRYLSVEIISGWYYVSEDTLHERAMVKSPSFMWKTGGKIAYQLIPKITFALSGDYSEKNIMWVGYHLELYGPPKITICSFSVLSFYENNFIRNCKWYAGAGLSFVKTSLFIELEKINVFHIASLANFGFKANIKSPLYIGIQGEICYSTVRWDSPELHIKQQFMPSITVNLGYEFNFKRRQS